MTSFAYKHFGSTICMFLHFCVCVCVYVCACTHICVFDVFVGIKAASASVDTAEDSGTNTGLP